MSGYFLVSSVPRLRSSFTTGSLDLKQDTNSASVYYYTFDAMLALKYSCFIASAAEQRCNGS